MHWLGKRTKHRKHHGGGTRRELRGGLVVPGKKGSRSHRRKVAHVAKVLRRLGYTVSTRYGDARGR